MDGAIGLFDIFKLGFVFIFPCVLLCFVNQISDGMMSRGKVHRFNIRAPLCYLLGLRLVSLGAVTSCSQHQEHTICVTALSKGKWTTSSSRIPTEKIRVFKISLFTMWLLTSDLRPPKSYAHNNKWPPTQNNHPAFTWSPMTSTKWFATCNQRQECALIILFLSFFLFYLLIFDVGSSYWRVSYIKMDPFFLTITKRTINRDENPLLCRPKYWGVARFVSLLGYMTAI